MILVCVMLFESENFVNQTFDLAVGLEKIFRLDIESNGFIMEYNLSY